MWSVADKTLLDTDILSELMRDVNVAVRSKARAYLSEHGRLTLSVITVLEIVKGLHKARRDEEVERFLDALSSAEVLTLGTTEATLAGRIYADLERIGRPIGRADPIVAAIAITHGLTLATGNVSHYDFVRQAGYERVLTDWRSAT